MLIFQGVSLCHDDILHFCNLDSKNEPLSIWSIRSHPVSLSWATGWVHQNQGHGFSARITYSASGFKGQVATTRSWTGAVDFLSMLVFTYIGVWVVFFFFVATISRRFIGPLMSVFAQKNFWASIRWNEKKCWLATGLHLHWQLSSKIRTLPFQFFLNLCANLPRPICVWTCT